MRLTLRTLLAWMDGVLPPAVATELASKVEASPAAQSLADRIRGLRGREATEPPPAGPDLASEINAVAEYLDNVLEADSLADFERECLASDARLMEVAACHRLLAEYAASAAPVVPRLEEPPPPAQVRPPRPVVAGESRSSPWASWLLATAATLLLVVLAGLFGWSVVRDRTRRTAVPADLAAAPAGPRAGGVNPRDPPRAEEHARDVPVKPIEPSGAPTAEPSPAAAREPVAAVMPSTAEPVAAETLPPDPGREDQPDQAAAVMPPAAAPAAGSLAIGVSVPSGDALAIGAPRPPQPSGEIPGPATTQPDQAAPPGAEDPPAAGPPLNVVAGPPLLRHTDGGLARHSDGGLARHAANSDEPPEWLAAPAGHSIPLPVHVVVAGVSGGGTVVTIDGLRMSLRPGSHVVFARTDVAEPGVAKPGNNAALVQLELLFGAVTIAGSGSVLVAAGDLTGIATVGPGGPLGVEVQLAVPPGTDPATAAVSHTAWLFTATAPVAWRQTTAQGGPLEPTLAGLPADGPLPPRSRVTWTDRDPAAVMVETQGSVPAWVTGGWPAERLDRAVADELTARLAADQPAAAALEVLARSPREEVRVAAAATLATLGEFSPLVRLLCAEGPPEALREGRWQELEAATVPVALARGPNSAAALGNAFAAEGPPGRGADLLRLARGFTDDELAAGADAWLVLALDDPRLVVRRYAIKNLHEITGIERADRLRYRADRDAGLRKDGVSWWRSRLEQGLVSRRGAAAPPRP